MKKKLLIKTLHALVAMLTVSMTARAQEAYAVLSDEGKTVTFYYDTQKESREGVAIKNSSGSSSPYGSTTTAVIDASFADYRPTSTAYWFYNCKSLTAITGTENLKTDNVTDMRYMFSNCSSLTSLDLSGFNTQNVTNMSYMFSGCSKLGAINVGDGWSTEKVTSGSKMFNSCTNIGGGQGTEYDSSHTDHTYARIDGGASAPGYFCAPGQVPTRAYAVLSDEGKKVTFYFDTQKESREGVAIKNSSGSSSPYGSATTAVIDASFADYRPTSTAYWFYNCKSLTAITGTENLKTDNVTDMRYMFSNCSSLTSLDLSGFNTQNVTNMSYMFSGCSKLGAINVGDGWSTEKVTSGSKMFNSCTNLVGGQGTEFDTSHTDHTYARIDGGASASGYFCAPGQVPTRAYAVLSDEGETVTFYFDTQKESREGVAIKNSSGSSSPYGSATTAVIDTSFADYRPTSTAYWFYNCQSLTTITGMGNLKTDNVTDMRYMFSGCSSLTSLDLSGFNTQNVTNMSYMFSGCSKLGAINVGDGWSTEKVTSGSKMFNSCTNLVGGQGTEFDTSHTDHTYARIDGGASASGYFCAPGLVPPRAYAVLSDEGETVTFYFDTQKESRGGININRTNGYSSSFSPPYSSATTAVIDASFADYRPTSTAYWFYNCQSLTTITGMGNLKTDNVTDMSYMFDGCSSLTSLDLSGFNTQNVTDMRHMFSGCSSLTSLDLSGFNTQNVTDMSYMFSGYSRLKSLDLSGFKTQNVTDMSYMFSGCSNLEAINVGDGWSTEKVTSGSMMFYGCTNLVGGQGTVYDEWYTYYTYARIDGGASAPGYFCAPGQVPPRAYAVLSDEGETVTFYFDRKKESRNGVNIKNSSGSSSPYGSATTAVIDASFADYRPTSTAHWFEKCSSLITITGMENLKIDNVTNMKYMFSDCSCLTSLDLSGFNTQNVENMSSMFYGCSSLTSLDLSGFNTQNVTNMTYMFYNCSSLTSLNLSGFSTQNVTNMSYMFYRCSKLETIYVGDGWSTEKITSSSASMMFYSCAYLVGGQDTEYDSKHTDHTYARIDGGTDTPGYFCASGQTLPYAVLSDEGKTVTFYYDTQKESRGGNNINHSYRYSYGSSSPYGSATTAVIDASFADYRPTSTAYWFYRCSALTTITGMENLKTDNVTDMSDMFRGCSSLTSLDLSSFKTDKVTNMSHMFYYCRKLTSLDLSGFKTDNVTDMSYMFDGCSSLTSLDVSSFKTDNVTNMRYMFSDCSCLTSLDVSGFKTDNVTDMSYMFSGCSNLGAINVGDGWSTEKVTSGSMMFYGCTNLVGGQGTEYDYSHTDHTYARIDGGTDTPGYFCAPGQVPIRAYAVLSDEGKTVTFYFDTQKESREGVAIKNSSGSSSPYGSATTAVIDASFADYRPTSTAHWFYNWKSLTTITGTGNLKTDNVTDMSYMFDGCSSLTSLDLSGFNTQNVDYMSSMFSGCFSLITIYVGDGWSTEKVTSGSSMFYGCTNLVGGQGTEYDYSHTDHTYARIDDGTDIPGYFSVKGQPAPVRVYAVLSDDGLTATYYYDNQIENRGGVGLGSNSTITTAVIDASVANAQLTSTAYWFYRCSALTTITGMENLKTDNVTDMRYMFSNCSSLTTLDLSGFKTDKVRYMGSMFSDCFSLMTIYVGDGWNTEKVTYGSYMFADCTSLVGGQGTEYDYSHTDHTYARIDDGTDIPGYFSVKGQPAPVRVYAVLSDDGLTATCYYDNQIENRGGVGLGSNSTITTAVIDASVANAQLTSTAYWFYRCSALTTITGMENLKTDNVTSMRGMFSGCSSLTTLDLSGFKTDKVRDMSSMFSGCSGLETIYAGDGWSTEEIVVYDPNNIGEGYMFIGCTNLVGGQGTAYDESHTYYTYAHIDGGTDAPGYFTAKPDQVFTRHAYAVLSDDGKTVTFYYDTQKAFRGAVAINNSSISDDSSSPYGSATTAVIDASFADYRPTSTAYWFYRCSALTTITGMENLKTDNVTDMRYMFSICHELTSLDLSGFKTDNVTDMSYMFSGYSRLKSLDLSGFKTQNVTDMSYMFSGCSSLTSLDVSSFKTDNVTNMRYMFSDCSCLTSLDLSGFKTDNVTDMSHMFYYCSSLTSLNLSSFKTDNVTDMRWMFYGCSCLKTINVGDGWSTEKVTSGSSMFYGCTNLVGGQGTTYDESHTYYTYARIDGGTSAPGYFTYKESAGIKGITMDGIVNGKAPVYDLGGRRLTAPQKGLNIVGGRKFVVK